MPIDPITDPRHLPCDEGVTTACLTVADLRERLEFAPIIADRIWHAWWKPKGYALAFTGRLVLQNFNDKPVPFAFLLTMEARSSKPPR